VKETPSEIGVSDLQMCRFGQPLKRGRIELSIVPTRYIAEQRSLTRENKEPRIRCRRGPTSCKATAVEPREIRIVGPDIHRHASRCNSLAEERTGIRTAQSFR